MMPAPPDLRRAGPPDRAALSARVRELSARLRELAAGVRDLPWRPVLLSWLAARAVVGLALVVAGLLRARDPDLAGDDLLGWDADWYHRIAEQGYADLELQGVRFFPLLPLLARALAVLVGDTGVALLLLSNGAALAFGLLLHRLAMVNGLGRPVADRAVWVAALAPAGFVNVMAYTESMYGALVCALLLAARDRRWLVVAALGLLLGLLRPPGVVLAPVVLVEALRGLRAAPLREVAARALAVAAPVVGLASYLLWIGALRGDPLLPLSEQTEFGRRGGTFVNPLVHVFRTTRGLLDGQPNGSALHLLWVVVAFGLLVVVVRRLPASYAVLSAATLVLAVTARSMSSFERYAASAVPLLLAAALVLSTRRRWRTALAVAPPVLLAYSVVAFLHLYVP